MDHSYSHHQQEEIKILNPSKLFVNNVEVATHRISVVAVSHRTNHSQNFAFNIGDNSIKRTSGGEMTEEQKNAVNSRI